MQAINPTMPVRHRPYAWNAISLDPDPPYVGRQAKIVFPLTNPGPDPIYVERIETEVSHFGIGLSWEALKPVGPVILEPDPLRVHRAEMLWTPASAGHRCIRAAIYVRGAREPYRVGRNAQVLEAASDEDRWHIPFYLGNPFSKPVPIQLKMGGNDTRALAAEVYINQRRITPDESILLRPGEMVHAEFILTATSHMPLRHVRFVEAYAHGALLDGIQATVYRPAYAERAPNGSRPDESLPILAVEPATISLSPW